MAEVLVNFAEPIKSRSGDLYYGRVLGRAASDGTWEGWIEFTLAGSEEAVSSPRAAGQRDRDAVRNWARRLEPADVEAELDHALTPVASPRPESARPSASPKRVALDPFEIFVDGEDLLRNQLSALSHDELRDIVEVYRLAVAADVPSLRAATEATLVEQIVHGVRARYAASSASAAGTEPAEEADLPNATAEDRSA